MSPLFLCSISISLAGPPLPDNHNDETWIVELVEQTRPHPRIHHEVTHQALVRKAPGKIERTVLLEQNHWGLSFLHRGDGTIIAIDHSSRHRLINESISRCFVFFPQSDRPVTIETVNGLDLSRNWHHVHFIDDFLLYSYSYPNERRWTLGLVQLDVAKQQVKKHSTLVETNHAKLNMGKLGVPYRSIVKIGDYLFWTNCGLQPYSDEPHPHSDWGHRKLRAIRLTDHTLITPDEIPVDAILPHKELLLETVEKKAHNVWPEFEVWAIGWLGQHHRTDDVMNRLRKLSQSIVEKTEGYVEIQYGRFSTAVPALTKAYQDVLKAKSP